MNRLPDDHPLKRKSKDHDEDDDQFQKVEEVDDEDPLDKEVEERDEKAHSQEDDDEFDDLPYFTAEEEEDKPEAKKSFETASNEPPASAHQETPQIDETTEEQSQVREPQNVSEKEDTLDDLATEKPEPVGTGYRRGQGVVGSSMDSDPDENPLNYEKAASATPSYPHKRPEFEDEEPIPSAPRAREDEPFEERAAVAPMREREDRFMAADKPYNSSSFRPRERNSKTAKWHIFVLVLIGILAIGGTVYLLRGQFMDDSAPKENTVEEVVVNSPTPVPTQAPAVDRSKFTVRVLNGTTTSGLAGTVSEKLKGLGYQTEKATNATNSAFARTVVRVKANQPALLEAIIKDLSPDYDATSSTALSGSDSADVEVIVGKE